ncbi:FAD-dependent oxidoreductase, partial [Pseudoalteromonas sp. S1727]
MLYASCFGGVLPRLLVLEQPSNFRVRIAFFSHFKAGIVADWFVLHIILINVHAIHTVVWYWVLRCSERTARMGVVAAQPRCALGVLRVSYL